MHLFCQNHGIVLQCLCDWVELQSKQAYFLFLQNFCSGLCVPGRWFLNAEWEVVWLFLPHVLQFYFMFSKGQIHLWEAPWHCKVLPPHLSYCFPVLSPLRQHKTHIPQEQLTKWEAGDLSENWDKGKYPQTLNITTFHRLQSRGPRRWLIC